MFLLSRIVLLRNNNNRLTQFTTIWIKFCILLVRYLSHFFTDFTIDELDGEKYQKFSLVIMEECDEEENEVLRIEIKFDQFYYYNLINKRVKYINIAEEVYK